MKLPRIYEAYDIWGGNEYFYDHKPTLVELQKHEPNCKFSDWQIYTIYIHTKKKGK